MLRVCDLQRRGRPQTARPSRRVGAPGGGPRAPIPAQAYAIPTRPGRFRRGAGHAAVFLIEDERQVRHVLDRAPIIDEDVRCQILLYFRASYAPYDERGPRPVETMMARYREVNRLQRYYYRLREFLKRKADPRFLLYLCAGTMPPGWITSAACRSTSRSSRRRLQPQVRDVPHGIQRGRRQADDRHDSPR